MLLWGTSDNAFWENAESFPGVVRVSREAGDHALLARERTSEYVPSQEQAEIRLASLPKDNSLSAGSKYITKRLFKE